LTLQIILPPFTGISLINRTNQIMVRRTMNMVKRGKMQDVGLYVTALLYRVCQKSNLVPGGYASGVGYFD
jgi:hypothetical protein